MSLGQTMKLKTSQGLAIELAPFAREDLQVFVEGFSREAVTQYLSAHKAQTIETEQEWYDKIIRDSSVLVWGIWVVENETRTFIGNTSLTKIEKKHVHQAVSGSVIVDTSYWGRGIATAIHKARTYYAFEKLGLHRISSEVLEGNIASQKALEKAGYRYIYTERNRMFTNGKLRHSDWFECLNPAEWAWRQWWGEDRPPKKAIESRRRTADAMEWAKLQVEL